MQVQLHLDSKTMSIIVTVIFCPVSQQNQIIINELTKLRNNAKFHLQVPRAPSDIFKLLVFFL